VYRVQAPDASDQPLLGVALSLGLADRGHVAHRSDRPEQLPVLVPMRAPEERDVDLARPAGPQGERYLGDASLGERALDGVARSLGVGEERAELAPDEQLSRHPEAHDRGVGRVGDGSIDADDEDRVGGRLDQRARVGDPPLGVGRSALRLAHVPQRHEDRRRAHLAGRRERPAELHRARVARGAAQRQVHPA
jgi:hypothetical protein